MSTPESKWKTKVDKLLKSYGSKIWYFSPQAGPYGKAGIPDRIACVQGVFVGVEVKADKTKKPTALQELCMRQIVVAGGHTIVVCDDETVTALKKLIEWLLSARIERPESAVTKAE